MIHLHRTLTCVIFTVIFLVPACAAGQLINGDFSSGLTGWDTYGEVFLEEGRATLRTGGIYGAYDTSLYTTFIVSGNSLDFEYYFDVAATDDIVSPDYPSYPFDTFQLSLDAGNEGYFVEALPRVPLGEPVPFSLDISNFSAGTLLTLSFDLLDQDDGYTSIAAIDNVVDPITAVPEPETLILLGGGLMALYLKGRFRRCISRRSLVMLLFLIMIPGVGDAYGELIEENVDDMTRLDFTSPVFNTKTNTLSLSMVVSNISDTTIHTPLRVIITGISTPDVTVANPDGYTPDGLPYYDLTGDISDQELLPGEAGLSIKILFYNPRRIKFRWDQDVLAFIDVYTETGPVLENICLVPGEFPPVCEYNQYDFEAEEPEFDNLLGRQLPEMYRMEQVRVYAYDYEELPLRVVINDMEAAYNEAGFYYYRDLILQEGLNTISIDVTNEAGISISRDIRLNIDTLPPNIEINTPSAGAVVTNPDLIIEGRVDDPDVESISVIINYINSRNIPVLNGLFFANIPLQPGHNNITIEASDLPGNSMTANLDIVFAYSGSSAIAGHILDGPLGLPVAGAEVTIVPQDGYYKSVVSDKDGSYRVDEIKSGDVAIYVEKSGYEPENIRICAIGGDYSHVQDITLEPLSIPGTFTLTGQITNTAGQPVEGVSVSIRGASLNSVTDRNGIYLISGIPRTSFEADTSLTGYINEVVRVDADAFGTDTSVLIHNFILNSISYSTGIIYPEDGGYTDGFDIVVKGFISSGDRDAGVRVNGILANVYNGFFVANGIPLSDGINNITAEMINEAGTIATDTIEISSTPVITEGVLISAQEAGIVPLLLNVIIAGPSGVSFTDGNLSITGPSAAEVISEGQLHHTVLINEPGIYLITFNGIDSSGNTYRREFGFTGMTRGDAEAMLRQRWNEFKGYLTGSNMDDALSMISPETRERYREQFLSAGEGLSDFFGSMEDISLVTLSDNLAKARVERDDVTHYIWFARDIYGLWRIHKF